MTISNTPSNTPPVDPTKNYSPSSTESERSKKSEQSEPFKTPRNIVQKTVSQPIDNHMKKAAGEMRITPAQPKSEDVKAVKAGVVASEPEAPPPSYTAESVPPPLEESPRQVIAQQFKEITELLKANPKNEEAIATFRLINQVEKELNSIDELTQEIEDLSRDLTTYKAIKDQNSENIKENISELDKDNKQLSRNLKKRQLQEDIFNKKIEETNQKILYNKGKLEWSQDKLNDHLDLINKLIFHLQTEITEKQAEKDISPPAFQEPVKEKIFTNVPDPQIAAGVNVRANYINWYTEKTSEIEQFLLKHPNNEFALAAKDFMVPLTPFYSYETAPLDLDQLSDGKIKEYMQWTEKLIALAKANPQ